MDWRAEIREEFVRLGKPGDDDIVEEMAQHADAAWATERAEGASPENASAAVRDLIRAWCSGTAGVSRARRAPLVESAPAGGSAFAGLGLDIRHALRLMRRQPGFSIVSILMIALGIAATSTIVSVINAVLWRPLPWAATDRIVQLAESRDGGTVNTTPGFTNAAYLAWKDNGTTIEAIGAWGTSTAAIEGPDGAERVPVARVTASLLPLLGVAPAIGPGFSDEDEHNAVVILSHSYWRDRLGSAPNVIGQRIRFVSGPRTVVGVMPAGFEFLERDTQLWIPMTVSPARTPGSNGTSLSLFSAIARLKPGVTPQVAADEAQRLARNGPDLGPVLAAVFGAAGPAVIHAKPIVDALVGDVRWALALLLVAVMLLWLAATANVASMQLAHAAGRQREVAIRAAIGAGRGRLVRQLLVETTLLSLCGAAVGLAVTVWLLRIVPGLLPQDFPRAVGIALDWRVAGVALVLIAGAAIGVGLLPARMAARLDVRTALSVDGGGATPSTGRLSPARARLMIITLQVAIATVLLVGASLFGRSFATQWKMDRGFAPANVLTARMLLPNSIAQTGYQPAYYDVLQRIASRPGVRVAGLSDGIPLGDSDRRFASTTQEPGRPERTISALLRCVSAGYMTAVGMRVSGGRLFNDQDSLESEPVAIVNRTFASRYLGDAAIGAVLPAQLDNAAPARKWRVVGIVDDAMRAGVTVAVQPEIFLMDRQVPRKIAQSTFITVRTSGDPNALAPDLRAAVRSVDRQATIDQVMTMDARILKSLSRPRLYAALFAGFGGFALLIAVVGLFGGLSYGVTQRTREISVRAALGATPADIVQLIVVQGFTLAAAGILAGLLAAGAGARVLGQFLYGISAWDRLSYGAVAAVLLLFAAIACALPARRAARIDPLKGMKQ